MVMQTPRRTRAVRARAPSAEEVFIDQHDNTVSTRREMMTGSDGESLNFTHTTADLVVLYFPVTWGWESREVPSTNMKMCIAAGARIHCGDCNKSCSPDPMNPQYNNCEGRPKFQARRCPECSRLIYDFGARSVNADLLSDASAGRLEEVTDGVLIANDDYARATPETRTKVALDAHIFRYHPSLALALAIKDPDSKDQPLSAGS